MHKTIICFLVAGTGIVLNGCGSSENAEMLAAVKKQNELLQLQIEESRTAAAKEAGYEDQLKKQNELLQQQIDKAAKAAASKEEEANRARIELRAKLDEMKNKASSQEAETRRQIELVRTAQKPVINVEPPQVTFRPTYSPPPAPPKKSADMIIKYVSVYSTKSNGDEWDESGPPDLKVTINGAFGGSFVSKIIKNEESATFDERGPRVYEGDEITVTVFDNDVAFDDRIGSYSKLITADTLAAGTVSWSFDRVTTFNVRFEP